MRSSLTEQRSERLERSKKSCVKMQLIINMKCFRFMIDEAEKLCIMRTSLTQSVYEKLKRKHIFDTAL
jgi:hypothetical protein